MSAPVIPVVIIGAGPTGLTAATLLAQYGVACLVLDRWDAVYPQPRAVHLDDEVYRILARLGIRDEFAAISRPCHGLRLLESDMTVLAELHRDTGTGRHGYPQANMFDQPELEALLRANLARYPSATVRGGMEVTALTQEGDGPVRVDVTDRVHGTSVDAAGRLRARLRRRQQHRPHRDRRPHGRPDVRPALARRRRGHRRPNSAQWEGVHQVCDAAPRRDLHARRRHPLPVGVPTGRPARPPTTTATSPGCTRSSPRWTKSTPLDQLHIVRVAEYTFRAQIADRWRDRRIFLLGDAAHLTPPFIGQGMGAGLRDAANLAWKLAAVLSGHLPDHLRTSTSTPTRPNASRTPAP